MADNGPMNGIPDGADRDGADGDGADRESADGDGADRGDAERLAGSDGDLEPMDVPPTAPAWDFIPLDWDAPPPPGLPPTWGTPQPWEPRPPTPRRFSPAHRLLALLAATALLVAGAAAAFSSQLDRRNDIPATRATSLDTAGGGV